MCLTRALVPTLLATLLVGCVDETTGPSQGELPPLQEGTARLQVSVETEGEGVAVASVSVQANALPLGAYQGRFRFDPDVMDLVDVTVPEGEQRFVNSHRAEDGEIRFAGFTVTDFATDVAAVMRFATARRARPQDFSAELEVLGDIMGRTVGRERIQEPALLMAR